MNDKGYFPPSKLFLLCGMCYLILRNLGETSRHFSIISTLAGKESSQVSRKRKCLIDNEVIIPNNCEGNERRSSTLATKQRKFSHAIMREESNLSLILRERTKSGREVTETTQAAAFAKQKLRDNYVSSSYNLTDCGLIKACLNNLQSQNFVPTMSNNTPHFLFKLNNTPHLKRK
ncbi:hypothetical protein YC2023_099553 [Brassica napus]